MSDILIQESIFSIIYQHHSVEERLCASINIVLTMFETASQTSQLYV